MGLKGKFDKKKPETSANSTPQMVTELEQLCGNDNGTYEALIHTMFLDPRKTAMPSKEAAENAKKHEKAKNDLMTKTWYEIAGGLAIYEGDTAKVVEYFSKIEKLFPDAKYAILKNPEKAVAKAREYYKKTFKE